MIKSIKTLYMTVASGKSSNFKHMYVEKFIYYDSGRGGTDSVNLIMKALDSFGLNCDSFGAFQDSASSRRIANCDCAEGPSDILETH